jgi:hypothetical protein
MTVAHPRLFQRFAEAVDRNIFVELLTRIARFQTLENHAYIGRSGFALDDQKLIYRTLGITRLLAFDSREIVVKRQRFNKPIEACRCRIMTVDEFTTDPAEALEEEGIEGAAGYIIWLRHARDHAAGEALRQFQELLGSAGLYTIVRVTVRSDFDDWAGDPLEGGKPRTVEERRGLALAELNAQIGDYLDPNTAADQLDGSGLASAIAGAYGVAAGRGIEAATGRVLEPLSIIEYDSGGRYLSMTGMVIQPGDRDDIRQKVGAGSWPFASHSWGDVNQLLIPDLTVRERLMLEYVAAEGSAVAQVRLGFDVDQATELPGFFDSFARYHRHYPVFLAAEL